MNPPAVAICYIIDVGMQAGGHSGSSNVIIFPRSSDPKGPHAVVIDCGDRSQTTRLLQSHKVSRIDHVFVTHNDRDHAGGILELINAFRNRVGDVWLLQDRPGPDIAYFPELQRLKDAGSIKGIRWLHCVALSAASESVLCTQITRQCCGDPSSLHPGVLRPARGVPQASEAADGRSGIACAGTVVVDIGPFPLEPRRWREHRRSVDQLHRGSSAPNQPVPLCRRPILARPAT